MSRRARAAGRGLIVVALLVGLDVAAEARPGGGHSYSGGGGSSYSGGGSSYSGGGSSYSGGGSYSSSRSGGYSYTGGGGEALLFLLVGLAIAIAVGLHHASTHSRGYEWTSAPEPVPYRPAPPDLGGLRRLDPEFSLVCFEDFVYRLIAQAHRARGRDEALAELAPYLHTGVRGRLAGLPRIEAVVIGAMRLARAIVPSEVVGPDRAPRFVTLWFEVELNCTGGDPAATYYVRETWRFKRDAAVMSRPPSTARTFGCPSCGARFTSSDGQRCDHCEQIVDTGRFDWVADQVDLEAAEVRPPSLTGTVEELGTHDATIVHPDKAVALAALCADDPAVSNRALDARLRLIYAEVNAAWNARDLAGARPYVSDGMHDYLRYWLECYAAQGLRNELRDARLERWVGAKVVRDAHYDAVTVRVWATGLDVTTDRAGDLVGGSASDERPYSEYWTLIRGAKVRGAPRTDRRCPSCGAELKIAMAGTCEFCAVHVTAGEFDWVLSKIEQDDSYRG